MFDILPGKRLAGCRKGLFIALAIAFSIAHPGCRPMRHVEARADREAERQFYEEFSAKFGYTLNGTENPVLLREIAGWLDTPHRFGGVTRQGVDCSGFVMEVFRVVYQVSLPRTSADMGRVGKKISRHQLREGDWVFFNTAGGRKVTHVGIYLSNNRFAHASSSLGVIISSLDERFYQRTFSHAGRVK